MARRTEPGTDLVEALLDDPRRSDRELAHRLGRYRQAIWRERRQLEKDGKVWGYTAVVDPGELGWRLHRIRLSSGPLTREFSSRLAAWVRKGAPHPGVHVTEIHALSGGPREWEVEAAVRTTLDLKHFLHEVETVFGSKPGRPPLVEEIGFCLVRWGKVHPQPANLAGHAVDRDPTRLATTVSG